MSELEYTREEHAQVLAGPLDGNHGGLLKHREITSAKHAYETLNGLAKSKTEEVWVLALGPKKTLIKRKMLFRGTVDMCLVHPRDVFQFACSVNASSILIAHNHPSGDPVPSYQDLRFTQQMIDASHLMEIPLIDHLIVTRNQYVSLRSEGWCLFQREDLMQPSSLEEEAKDYSPDSSYPEGAAP